MTDISTPQSLAADQYAIGLDETGTLIGSVIDESQISYAVLGKPTTSTTQNDVGTGVKTFTLDTDNGITVDDPVRIKSLDDPVCWMYGICTARDTSSSPIVITVLVYRCSDLTITGQNWQIQRTPNFASLSSSVLGYATDSLEFGSGNDIVVGASITITTDAGKLFNPGSHILVSYVTDSTQYFRGVAQRYDSATGELNLFVTDVGPDASGTYAAWSVVAQDGPATNATTFAFSSTSNPILTPADQGVVTFEIQSSKNFEAGTIVSALYAADQNIGYVGQVTSYDDTTITVSPFKVLGTPDAGTFYDAWLIQAIVPALSPQDSTDARRYAPFIEGNSFFMLQDNGLAFTALATGNTNTAGSTRLVTINPNDASRTVSLSGNLTVSSDTTISGTNTGDQDLSGYVPATRTVNGHALSANVTVTASDVGLGSVTNDAQTKAAIVPNTAPAAGDILIGNAGGTAYAKNAMSGDVTITSAGVAAIKSSVALAGSPTTTTQSAGDNSTKIATTAYVDAATASGWQVVGTANTAFPTGTNSLSVTGITKDDLLIYFTGVSSTSAGWTLRIQPNGDTTAADYAMQNVVTPAAGTVASLFNPAGITTAAANTTSGIVQISGAQQAVTKPVNSSGIIGSNRSISLGSWESTAVIASITFLLTAGNFDAGTYTVMQRGG